MAVKVISAHLGHSDTRTTDTIYAHVFARNHGSSIERYQWGAGNGRCIRNTAKKPSHSHTEKHQAVQQTQNALQLGVYLVFIPLNYKLRRVHW